MSPRQRTPLSCGIALLLCLTACVLRAPLDGAPCDPDGRCVAGFECVDGVCLADVTDAGPLDGRDAGPSDAGPDDAGPSDAGPTDAGPSDAGPTDAGPSDAGPSDAGPSDAGPTDAGASDAGPRDAGPTVLPVVIVVTARDAVPAGYPVSVPLEDQGIDSSGLLLRVNGADTSLPWVIDPAPFVPTTLWFALPSALPADGSAAFELLPDADGGPAPDLEAVFAAGSHFGATLPLTLVSTFAYGATVTMSDGELRAAMPQDEEAAAVVRLDEVFARGSELAVRHRVRVSGVGGTAYPPAFVRQLAVLQGDPPVVNEDNFNHFLRELLAVNMTADGAAIWYTLPSTDLVSWDGSAWTSAPNTYWGPLRTDELEIELISEGGSWRVIVRDPDGLVLTETTPVSWSQSIEPPDAGGPTGPTWVFWGEPFAGSTAAYFYGDFASDYAFVRPRVAQEPIVSFE